MIVEIQNNGAYLYNGYELASVSRRFLAAIIDGIIGGIIVFTVLRYYPYEESMTNPSYIESMTNASNIYHFIMCTVIYFFINYSCFRKGQTIGMRILNIQVTDLQGNVASIWRMFFFREIIFDQIITALRYTITSLIYSHYVIDYSDLIKFIGALIYATDLVFIYREDHRTLHDFFARTIVIKLSKKSQDNNNLPKMEG